MRARRGMGPAVAAALLALASPAVGQRPEVVELRFEGARAFGAAELGSAISTSETRCANPVYYLVCWLGLGEEEAYLEPGALEADAFRLKVYYYERGYREAEIAADTVSVDDGVEVTFRIHEGRPVRVAGLEVTGVPDAARPATLPVRTGRPYDMVATEAARDTLLAGLRNAGYARAQVLVNADIFSDAPYEAVLRYDVVPGPLARFGEITVAGNREASPALVHRMLTFERGDHYDRSALLRSQRNLYGLQIFRHADVEADLDAEPDTVVPVTVRVAEGDMHRVRLGGGLNNIECGNVEGRWTSRNFLGDGRRFTVTGRLGNILIDQCGALVDQDLANYKNLTGLLSLDFAQPWLFGPRNTIGAGLFAERRNVPEVFVRSAVGGYLSVGRNLGPGATLTLGYRPELTELRTHQEGDLFFCVNFVGCTFEHVRVLQEPHLLSPVALSLTVDRTDALFSPSRGYSVRADLEHAGGYTLSDFSYTRAQAQASLYVGEPNGLILATRLRGGVGWAHPGGVGSATLGLNPQKRFYAGGPHSVRGYDQYRLGPTVLGIDAVPWLVTSDDPATGAVEGAGCTAATVNDLSCDVRALAAAEPGRFDVRPSGGEVLLEGNLELRFPLPVLGGQLRGAAFLDAGQVWRTRSEVALGEVVASPGVGVRYYSPIGPIRVDAAFTPAVTRELRVLTTRVAGCLDDDPACRRIEGSPRATLVNTDVVAPLDRPVAYNGGLGEIHNAGDFFRRINLQFSIGQAF